MAQKSLLGISLVVHGAIGLAIAHMELKKARMATAIEVSETKKPEPQKKPEQRPKAAAETPKRAARRAAPVEKSSEPPPSSEQQSPIASLPDFGLELGGGVGGIPVAVVPVAAAVRAPVVERAPAPVIKRPTLANTRSKESCDEPLQKPKPRNVPQPVYPDRARQSGAGGKVRIELTVDESGRVISARVLHGLGYGLDEAALAAAERATFEPALRCGKPARATVTMGIRFSAT